MKQRYVLAGAFGLVLLWAQGAAAQVAPLHVLASNAVKVAVEALRPGCERAMGRPLTIEYGASAAFMKKINAGEVFDLAILTPDATADLVKAGKIQKGTAADLAHTGVGFGNHAGMPKPDVSTPEAVKQTLLKAKSIAFAKEGAARPVIDKMFERLGIAKAVASKVQLTDGTDEAGQRVAKGQSELEIVLFSEIPLVEGVQVVGPLPKDMQGYLSFQVSVGTNTKDGAAARKAIQYLTSPAAAPAFKAHGMEPK